MAITRAVERLQDNTKIAEAVDKYRLEYDLTWQQVAYELGHRRRGWNGKMEGDATSVLRQLGFIQEVSNGKKRTKRKRITDKVLLKYVNYIGAAPVDYGL